MGYLPSKPIWLRSLERSRVPPALAARFRLFAPEDLGSIDSVPGSARSLCAASSHGRVDRAVQVPVDTGPIGNRLQQALNEADKSPVNGSVGRRPAACSLEAVPAHRAGRLVRSPSPPCDATRAVSESNRSGLQSSNRTPAISLQFVRPNGIEHRRSLGLVLALR